MTQCNYFRCFCCRLVLFTKEFIAGSPPSYLDLISFLKVVFCISSCDCRAGFTVVPGPVCTESLGMETRKIPDSAITASTFWGSGIEPHFSRFGSCKIMMTCYNFMKLIFVLNILFSLRQQVTRKRVTPQASQTHDSRNRSNIYDLCTRIEWHVTT